MTHIPDSVTDTQLYPAQVFWSREDQGFVATAPDLPGCSAFGATQEQALKELQSAIEAWKEAANAIGNSVPEPSRPAEENFSGKVLLRMPRVLHSQLAHSAKENTVSLNQYIVFLLTREFTRCDFATNVEHAAFLGGWLTTTTSFTASTDAHMRGLPSCAAFSGREISVFNAWEPGYVALKKIDLGAA